MKLKGKVGLTKMSDVADSKQCPILKVWKPKPEELIFRVDEHKNVVVNCSDVIPVEHEQFTKYLILMHHYQDRMEDITLHINYFINKFDDDREYYLSMLSTKFVIEKNAKLSQNAFIDLIMNRIVTDNFTKKIEKMVDTLYTLDVDKDSDGDYKSTPKITNATARVILAVSFAIRMVLLPCIHYVNISSTITAHRAYIPLLGKIFMKIIKKFEDYFGEPVYAPICKFVTYRIVRKYPSDLLMWTKKKQAHGTSFAEYVNELIFEVIIVKSIYKISFDQSVVSYFDGIINKNYIQFKSENYKCKPIELSAEDFSNDSDDYLSHGEAIEMSLYHIDESNTMINDVNIDYVFNKLIFTKFAGVPITPDEFNFYKKHVKINKVTHALLHTYYSKYFGDSSAIQQLTLEQTIYLLVVLKKFLQMKGMVYLPQICTATIKGKFKENPIKNCKFVEKFTTTNAYPDVKEKYKYVFEAYPKDDPLTKLISTMINSTFIWVDPDIEPESEKTEYIPMDELIEEYQQFLLIA